MSADNASNLAPANASDVMVIRKLSPNITTLSLPFARFGKLRIGGRGTIGLYLLFGRDVDNQVVRLRSGALAVFSPVALTPEVKDVVTALGGNLRYMIAPDMEHHLFLGPWHQAFPEAKVIGPGGLPEKRAHQKNETVPFSHVFTPNNCKDLKIDPEFDAEFDYEYVYGHVGKELVFNYKPEKTLIEADLMFNLPAKEQYSRGGETNGSGLLTKLFTSINSTYGAATWQKRFIWYASSSKDRPAFNRSIARIEKWDFDKIVMCHGDVIESGGKGIFRKVFEWHLQAVQKL
ncbi:hypothetical protein FGG08_005774 [Glutinoglossum americanum]|uniref:DUF4336 domain-containing protein n=1 Tax=Glutinoglossum americanum TaxID=1670608 RepID=A0A9P8I4U3_9PEZI|nr:hypothetical protein FGG08_005774 [Glutinoglossum americanum]